MKSFTNHIAFILFASIILTGCASSENDETQSSIVEGETASTDETSDRSTPGEESENTESEEQVREEENRTSSRDETSQSGEGETDTDPEEDENDEDGEGETEPGPEEDENNEGGEGETEPDPEEDENNEGGEGETEPDPEEEDETETSGIASEAISNAMVEIDVDGVVREYRMTAPANPEGTLMPVLIGMNGGGMKFEPFPQESKFTELAETEGFIFVIPRSDLLPENEGEWILNTTEDTRRDLDFLEAIIDDLAADFAVDRSRLYVTGYSLGSMFNYEVACHLSGTFAAVASHAGTMPITPASCELEESIAVMHIHGVLDGIIPYSNEWDWKNWPTVGPMMAVPGLIEYWKNKYNCQSSEETDGLTSNHVVHSDCDGGTRVEHHRLPNVGHEWPTSINGTYTHEIIWNFVSEFSLQ